MLSAEHTALQHRLVQQLASIRQQEMDYMLARYNSIATQAALIAGFGMASFSTIYGSKDDGDVRMKYS